MYLILLVAYQLRIPGNSQSCFIRLFGLYELFFLFVMRTKKIILIKFLAADHNY